MEHQIWERHLANEKNGIKKTYLSIQNSRLKSFEINAFNQVDAIVTITDESLKELGVRWGIFNPTEAAHRVGGSLDANGFSNISNNLNVNFATTVTPAGRTRSPTCSE